MQRTVSAMTARKRLGQLLEEAYYRGNVFIIERAGRPMAAVVPLEQYRQWQQRRADFFAMINQLQEQTREVPLEELEAAIAEAVAAAKVAEKVATELPS